jgi:NAD+ synthase
MNSEKVAKKIEAFIKRKVKQSGARGVVIGISGGLDSAVVATLCARALGSDNILGLILPSHTNRHRDIEDAQDIAARLGISKEVLPLGSIQEQFNTMLRHDERAMGNLTARIRMCLLYYFANHFNYLVVGTGNKSEIAIGYSTKYGDGGTDMLPIGDLYKTDVKHLARYLKIPKRIINKKPSAGLWPGQTDEDEIGMTYEWLDKVLSGKAKSEKVDEMVRKSAHKRKMPEVCKI